MGRAQRRSRSISAPVALASWRIRMALAQILDIPLSNLFRIKIGTASVTRVEYAEQGDEFLGQLIFHAGKL